MIEALTVEQLCKRCDPNALPFTTTEELEELSQVIGQARALEALHFGVGIQRKGYNLYAMGPPGTGKHAVIRRALSQHAAGEPKPSDWVYVNNFADSHQPLALQLPGGRGEGLRQDMEQLLEDLKDALRAAFESEDYRLQVRKIEDEFKRRQEQELKALQRKAQSLGIALLSTNAGFALAPMKNGEVLSPDEFEKLPQSEKEKTEQAVAELQEDLQRIARQMPKWRREHRERMKGLNQEVALAAVGHLMEELQQQYAELPHVQQYLKAVQQDVLDNLDSFLTKEDERPALPFPFMAGGNPLQRYQVNVLVSHANSDGAPLVYEDNPTFQNLIGRTEYMAQFGTLVTNFMLIKPGALHKANGGYLLLDVRHLFSQPFAWEALKRALFSAEIRIVSLSEMFSLVSTVSLEPQPIPLQIKVVLLGERLFYYLLYQLDPDFRELFKVAADLEEEIDRDGDNDLLYARLLTTLIRKESLRPFSREAVARVIEYSARMAEDAEKLSIHMQTVTDLLQEADFWAAENRSAVVDADHVRKAVNAQRYRSGRIPQKLVEAIRRGIVLIDTGGEQVGQINGLAILDLGDSRCGQPARITATVRLGSGQVVDIEREAELGGAIHSKGVMILSSFLGARYAGDYPLSLQASLVFEQSYAHVEGDSASLAELCALLSALAEAPIKQSFAITGSVNQRGQVQAIGGVNDKIEGFFEVCVAHGGPDGQAVIIPDANRQHLMLREEVVEAVARGRFHIYAVKTVDEALELLTGLPAGERDSEGRFPEGSLNRRVDDRLIEFSERRQTLARGAAGALQPSVDVKSRKPRDDTSPEDRPRGVGPCEA
jgi:lon-related putative ATP-dependent protease